MEKEKEKEKEKIESPIYVYKKVFFKTIDYFSLSRASVKALVIPFILRIAFLATIWGSVFYYMQNSISQNTANIIAAALLSYLLIEVSSLLENLRNMKDSISWIRGRNK